MLKKSFTRLGNPIKSSFYRFMSSTQENEVILETINSTGIITLNRPKVHNSLNTTMVESIYPSLQQWEKNKSLVIIKGAGDKAFCAGGDVKAIAIEASKDDKSIGKNFFWQEYRLNALIGLYKIPYVAFIDKITIGGGVGLSVHGRYRVATERTLFAMPETKIGFFPDVGGSYFLPRLRGNIGIYLGLTGFQLKGQDVFKAGIATHYVPSERLNELQTLLTRSSNEHEIYNLLNKFTNYNGEFSLAPHLDNISRCFSASSIEEIYERLERLGSDWAKNTINTLNQMCPSSLKITLRALQRGSQLDLQQCLQMEYRLASRSLDGTDFIEGVRALLIDKDNNPKWNPKTLSEVTESFIEDYFKKLPSDQELHFNSNL